MQFKLKKHPFTFFSKKKTDLPKRNNPTIIMQHMVAIKNQHNDQGIVVVRKWVIGLAIQ